MRGLGFAVLAAGMILATSGCNNDTCYSLALESCRMHGDDSSICQARISDPESSLMSDQDLCRKALFIYRAEGSGGQSK